ncbi:MULTISPECIES: enoyl-CoA hydratase-related protein [Bradyrhizobium]|uniref:3-hydroxyacyl-CoA dehydrogenase / enoyl-CoA hydratase / 3-hydroxybutyryl-CoA epimerase n=2 Tax=Bradyrhizobium TaxID=374 RepID=A0ABY0P8R8_9BRAD|nr:MULTISPECIES: enoyl-CoA hydratase-related protein [Bradyrhizobium]SDH69992.1 3-hydroxyacyl-CoA dehydrogenase / enoyl-CoA hydratase / 3-hydroxybutyryl-CoA epimerase [Bradyrhizobium ottawaense]SEE13683.1 3-hydroxyacyl-CoA dehydrogenase / enoyl-CoA hydratase / 3-hydroxybutyryl-CoA epimerase [Bradyrhizobium lablabi]SHM09803.1 Enoyl-CoA hydratase/carnithine racemase [Bradyrhizobium lablabi]
MSELGKLQQFRAERTESNILHLVFDMPGRPMNVFSNAAIAELSVFSQWLRGSDVRGVVIRSGKRSAFCAGADLAELGLAYDMIMAAPAEIRGRVAFDHFFPLSQALRAIETAGKPVVAAISGLALGGGGELALAAHHRVMVDDPKVAFGLPESLVGLLPGAGGTQRLPRLAGIEKALPVLLEGARLSGQAALAAGVVDQLVPAGEEVAAAERWVLSHASVSQPWDRPGWRPVDLDDAASIIERKRQSVLAETLGNYPAPLAILDCVSEGLPQSFDAAIRTEMQIFAKLIQRREPRNMIRTLFLGRLDHDRLRKAGGIPAPVEQAVAVVSEALRVDEAADATLAEALARAGFQRSSKPPVFDGVISQSAFWLEAEPVTDGKRALRERLTRAYAAADKWRAVFSEDQRRAADYLLVKNHGFPAYIAGAFSSAEPGA